MNSLTIRPFHLRDIPAILEIQNSNPEAAQWPPPAYERLEKAGERAWVAESLAIIGFIVARAANDEMEILNLAVDPSSHRQGVGKELLHRAISWAEENRVCRVFLEVRSSNTAATKFYEANGFSQTGIRPKYYSHPVEAALLLARSLDRK